MTEPRTAAYVHERVRELSHIVERVAPEGRALDLLDAAVRKKLAPILQRAPEAVGKTRGERGLHLVADPVRAGK